MLAPLAMNFTSMSALTEYNGQDTGRASLLLPAWQSLIHELLLDQPDVVVLVARKMPRVAELLGIEFSKRTSVIADVALPFCGAILRGARVAVVDDIVNVGTTLQRAAESALNAGAISVKLYSLGHRNNSVISNDSRFDHFYSMKGAFSERQYRAHVRSIPSAISSLAKPFDLAFPIIPCAYPIGITSGEELARELENVFGQEWVQVIPSPYHNSPVRRLTIWPDEDHRRKDRKLRMYFDDANRICRLVPIALCQPIAGVGHKSQNPIWNALRKEIDSVETPISIADRDALASIAVFENSLRWFDCSVAPRILQSIMRPLSSTIIDIDEMALLFGPSVYTLVRKYSDALPSRRQEGVSQAHLDKDILESDPLHTSPFLLNFEVTRLLTLANFKMKQECPEEGWEIFDVFTGVKSLLDSLAEMVGADDASHYSLQWPFSVKEVELTPYLRLRVGPTYGDLISLVKSLANMCGFSELASIERAVSLIIDMCVDQGSIVPTYAHYGNETYRIYRRGEQDQYWKIIFRAQLAWQNSQLPMSLTRFSKVMAILSHSNEFPDSFECGAETRGTVALLRPELSSDQPIEISHHLRDTGRLKVIDINDIGDIPR